ncbi:MAG: [protein-PII] uridylyltransferase, partial [Planktomarina sp.]
FLEHPKAARGTTKAFTYLTDQVIVTAYQAVCEFAHPMSSPTTSERLAVVAVGGCGRGEMAPASDVDLLFVTPYKITPWVESVVESLLYILWDLKLKVGHATRSVQDCLRLAGEDYTIRTSLVEQRFLMGDPELAHDLTTRLRDELFKNTASDFVEAKLTERAERHLRQGGQRYVVEPNVKEAKGGLRDLQSLFWIGKYVNDVSQASELVDRGVFTATEYDTFAQAEDFLWAIRCHLHFITKRANDQLTFDLQVEVAERMGYQDHDGRRAVEHFMQDYFRHATQVGELTRIFLTAMEAAHIKKEPSLFGFLKRKPKVRAGYYLRQNRLAILDDAAFLADKLNLLRLFEEGLRSGVLIHPDAMRLVAANLHLIDNDMRNSAEAVRIFCDLLLKHGNPERSLRRMNELGVLSAFIPEFEPIVAMMQFNMYHSYTVDEHTIQTISHLARIERGELVEELPIASGILEEGLNRRVLYIALLLHDIGKGRSEDHSILGAKIVRVVAPRLGLKKQDVETVEWLVRYHLLMSDMAQKRDIADPRTVRDFAKAVQSVKRLDLLTVLTVCDISGVGPGVWNNWKAVLIRALYRQTRRALETGLEDLNRQNRGAEAKKKLRNALSDWPEKELRRETNRHYPPYWQGLHITAHEVFAGLLKDIPDNEIRVDLQPDEDRDATRALFAMIDHPGIFSRTCGALALVGANVVDARTFTTKDGYVTSAFWIQDANGSPYETERLPRLEQMINKTLKGEVIARDAIQSKDKIKKRERKFKVPTSITFDNDGSEIYTIIEVDTRDRPGLLYDLTRTLAGASVNISSAVIATYGEQVVDTFYVKDMFGLKYHSKPKQEMLEQKLRTAISEGAERALT